MTILKVILVLFVCLQITSCGGGVDTLGQRDIIARLWLPVRGNSSNMDFSRIIFDTNVPISFRDSTGALQCTCIATFTGSIYKGIYTMDCPITCPGQYTAENTSGGTYNISGENVLVLCKNPVDARTCEDFI